MKQILNILLYIWQLPQNLLGLILDLWYEADHTLTYKGKTIKVCKRIRGGISLGNTIIVNKYPNSTKTWNMVKHEYGHSIQSLYLGPLYLIVVGIPSLLWSIVQGRIVKKDYFSVFPENWADKLGNVKR